MTLEKPTAENPARLGVQIHLPVRPFYKIGDICTALVGMGRTVGSLARLLTGSKDYQPSAVKLLALQATAALEVQFSLDLPC